MKIRNDFVSNSSSSSFILADCVVFDTMNTTKADIFDALLAIYGKDEYDKYVEHRKKTAAEYPEYNAKTIKYGLYGPFIVYDMSDPADRAEAIDCFEAQLSEWESYRCAKDPATGELRFDDNAVNKMERLVSELKRIYDFDGMYGMLDDVEDLTMFMSTDERQPDGRYGYDVPVPDFVKELIKDVRKRCGVVSNADVLKSDCARFFVHYDDNEIWTHMHAVYGMNDAEPEIFDENDQAALHVFGSKEKIYEANEHKRKEIDEQRLHKYESDCYTSDRVFEVLFRKLVEMKRIDPTKHKWRDLAASCMTINTHEG